MESIFPCVIKKVITKGFAKIDYTQAFYLILTT